jgi:hypothetical protein
MKQDLYVPSVSPNGLPRESSIHVAARRYVAQGDAIYGNV